LYKVVQVGALRDLKSQLQEALPMYNIMNLCRNELMSKKDLIVAVSRGVALYFFAWALDNVTYLPGQLRALSHHLRQQSVLAADHYWRNGDILSIALAILPATILFAVAIWLYRCGSRVEEFFSPHAESQE
jgi:hypothetical protein